MVSSRGSIGLIEGLTKVIHEHKGEWDKYVAPVLFSYRTSKHSTTKVTPFFLVYGRDSKQPSDGRQLEKEPSLVHHIATQIDYLPIVRNQVKQQISHEQLKQKDQHDDKLTHVEQFAIGDMVLYYRAMLDNQRSRKLEPKWKGPYYIHSISGNGAYRLREIKGQVLRAPVNGAYLKKYKARLPYEPPPYCENEH